MESESGYDKVSRGMMILRTNGMHMSVDGRNDRDCDVNEMWFMNASNE